ncbi:TPA: GIY-YIG nuclease family protein [Clostridioides difficile]|nr:GIY-YIG nuclease family protein [Clostridioides difficile]HCU2820296.1 GIY-YIG nuclease family protein [Clostridioides difficile]
MKIKYIFDDYGEVTEKNKLQMNLVGKCSYKDTIGYIYILNIEGSNVCKIGTAFHIFERIGSIRQIVKCVFPYVENAITYNVFISKPVFNKFKLEKTIHNIFSEKKLDGEWFNSSFEETIKILKQEEVNYIHTEAYNNILSLFDPNIYYKYIWHKDWIRLVYLKSIINLGFHKFIDRNYSNLFNNSSTDLRPETSLDDILELLKNYQKYINDNKKALRIELDIDSNKFYNYINSVNKKLSEFIEKYKRS